MKVYKFGGTSVGKPERMHQVMQLITRDAEPKIVVLSAVSGTTNALVQIGEKLYQKDTAGATQLINELYDKYKPFVQGLYTKDEYRAKGMQAVDKQFEVIRSVVKPFFSVVEERLILAQGELISTQLFIQYLAEQGVDSEMLWALDYMSIDDNEEPELDKISEKLKALLASTRKVQLYVTQGYICMNHKGQVDNLKRGGSDYTASLVGAASDSKEVQIWTDIDGMHNNDPRVVSKTFPVHELSFDEAAELAYFGAKILHPSTIRPAADKNIPVLLLNTMDPEAKGTVISTKTGSAVVKAVAVKDNITAIHIKSSRMFMAYGFLRKAFEVFEKHKTSIDVITTSEIAVSLTIESTSNLETIIAELSTFCTVDVDKNQCIVSVVGMGIGNQKGIGEKIFESLNDIYINMVSYGGSKNNISVVINQDDKIKALSALNSGLFGL